MEKFQWFINRFKEPSSYSGLAFIWVLIAPGIPFDLVTAAGVGVCALLSVVLKEKGKA